VRFPFGGGTLCIDATEVTNDQYAAFLAANPQPSSRSCRNHGSFQPSQGWPYASSDGHLPVVWVDWCDADAFCSWAGKSLCGAGSNNGLDPNADPTLGEWYAACSGPSSNAYPYGASYVAGTCNDTAPSGRPSAVESHAACVGGVSGLFDMSGNVAEWEDACTGWSDTDSCSVRGGGFDSTSSSNGLACAGRSLVTRSNGAGNVGIRCCSS
jgi:formylglycine-generating enzyme required for sulfatase activity